MHDASVNSEPGSNSPLELIIIKPQAAQWLPIANLELLTFDSILFWINFGVTFKAVTCLWALNRFTLKGFFRFKSPIRTLLSNFQRAKFPLCSSVHRRQGKFFSYFLQLHCCKNIITKNFRVCQALFLKFFLTKVLTLTTLIVKQIFKRLSSLFW